MTYSADALLIPDPMILNPSNFLNHVYHLNGATASAIAWPTANLAMYFPIVLGARHTYQRIFWIPGATVTGNIDIGMYDAAGNQLYHSTALALGSASVINTGVVAPTFSAGPGLVYVALSISSATGTLWCYNSNAVSLRGVGVYQQATAHPLPATATFAACTTARMPVFGFSELTAV